MKRLTLSVVAVCLVASPAWALKVTNLDAVPHIVELAGAGEPQYLRIAPDATEYMHGAANGMLSLVEEVPAPKGKKTVKKAPADDGVVHADGILSGIIGAARTSNIPADPDSSYVIWPGGKLQVQMRSKHDGRGL